VFQWLASTGAGLLTVSHHVAGVLEFHTHVLALGTGGVWEVTEVPAQ